MVLTGSNQRDIICKRLKTATRLRGNKRLNEADEKIGS